MGGVPARLLLRLHSAARDSAERPPPHARAPAQVPSALLRRAHLRGHGPGRGADALRVGAVHGYAQLDAAATVRRGSGALVWRRRCSGHAGTPQSTHSRHCLFTASSSRVCLFFLPRRHESPSRDAAVARRYESTHILSPIFVRLVNSRPHEPTVVLASGVQSETPFSLTHSSSHASSSRVCAVSTT